MEILTYATTWMNLENITLSEICQPRKDKYHMISLYETFRVVQIIETESRRLVAGAEGRGERQDRKKVNDLDREREGEQSRQLFTSSLYTVQFLQSSQLQKCNKNKVYRAIYSLCQHMYKVYRHQFQKMGGDISLTTVITGTIVLIRGKSDSFSEGLHYCGCRGNMS